MDRRGMVALCLAGLLTLGCGANQIFGSVMDDATDRVGEEIAERVVNAYLGDIGPNFIREYSIALMQTMFYQAGYYGEELEYEPGEYTIFTSDNSPYGETMERAFLRRRDDGWEWWRLEVFGEDPENDEDVHLIMEALFEPKGDKRYVRRMFVQYPDDEEPTLIEVTEEESERWAMKAERWSDERLESAHVDEVEIQVPAGTFTTDHYQADAETEQGHDVRTEWWQSQGQEVPGSVVQVRQIDRQNNDEVQTLRLESYGTGADESVLGAF